MQQKRGQCEALPIHHDGSRVDMIAFPNENDICQMTHHHTGTLVYLHNARVLSTAPKVLQKPWPSLLNSSIRVNK